MPKIFLAVFFLIISSYSKACVTLTERRFEVAGSSFAVNQLAFDHTDRGLALSVDGDLLFFNRTTNHWCIRVSGETNNTCLRSGGFFITHPSNPNQVTGKIEITPNGVIIRSASGTQQNPVIENQRPAMNIIGSRITQDVHCNQRSCSGEYGGTLFAKAFSDGSLSQQTGMASYSAAPSLEMTGSWEYGREDESFSVQTRSLTRSISLPPRDTSADNLQGQNISFLPNCSPQDTIEGYGGGGAAVVQPAGAAGQ